MADELDTAPADEKVDETPVLEDADTPEGVAAADVEHNEEVKSPGRLARWRVRGRGRRLARAGSALVASILIVTTLGGLVGWLEYRNYQKHDDQARRNLFVATARQGAVNLTTINFTQVDADVQRILDLATGAFRDDFEQRSKPFIEVVKAAQSKSEGTVTDAGLESQRGNSAQVLVAVAVKSQTAGGEQPQREWRMRIEVRSVGADAKVSNVVFVP